jgi:anti-sigma B factor antagonist
MGLTGDMKWADPELTAAVLDGSQEVCVRLVGDVDVSTAGKVREALVCPEVLVAQRVRLDLRSVTFLDSCGVSILVSACKRIRAAGGTVSTLCGASRCRRFFELAGLIDFFEVEDTAE